MASPMQVNTGASHAVRTCQPNRCGDAERRAQGARMTPTRDLSRDLGKIRLAALGKRSEGFPRLARLQTFAKYDAFPSDLSGDLVDIAHQRLGMAKRPGRPFGQSLGGPPR